MAEQKQWMTTQQVADRIGCSTTKVQSLAKSGDLVAARMGNGSKAPLIFERTAVEAYVGQQVQPAPHRFQSGNTAWAGSGSTGAIANTLRQILSEQQRTNGLLQQQLDVWGVSRT